MVKIERFKYYYKKLFLMIRWEPKEWSEKVKDVFKKTAIEIYIVSALGALLGGVFMANHESYRANYIPLGFSDIAQIEKEANNDKGAVGPVGRYLTSTNDAVMKVFECRNRAYANSVTFDREIFARELENKMVPEFKIDKYELFNYLDNLPEQSENALAKMDNFNQVRKALVDINSDLNDAWTDIHIDIYRTETHTDEDGNVETEQVYDHTIHTYTYHPDFADVASSELNKIVDEYYFLGLDEKFITIKQTDAEKEYLAEKSRKNISNLDKRMTPEQLLEIANNWYFGSTIKNNIPKAQDSWSSIKSDSTEFDLSRATAHSERYITYSPYDNGPYEFRVCEQTLDDGIRTYRLINEMISGIDFVQEKAPVLEAKINELIKVELDKKDGNARKLANQIIDISMDMYKLNFNEGFDIHTYRVWLVILAVIGGGGAGAAAGYGLDKLTNKYNLYDKKIEDYIEK